MKRIPLSSVDLAINLRNLRSFELLYWTKPNSAASVPIKYLHRFDDAAYAAPHIEIFPSPTRHPHAHGCS